MESARVCLIAIFLATLAGCDGEEGSGDTGPTPADSGADVSLDTGAPDQGSDAQADLGPPCTLPCHPDATCKEEQGSLVCVCQSGFFGDGYACTKEGRWIKHVVGKQPMATYIVVADLDEDGKLDIVSSNTSHMSEYKSEIAWFRNTGKATWDKIVVSSSTASSPVINATGVAVADVDGDGALDIVSAASGKPGGGNKTGGAVYWFQAPKSPGGAWKRFAVEENAPTKYWKAYTFDPDGDKNPDIVVGGNSSAVLFVNPGKPADPAASWTKSPLPQGTGIGIDLADVDGDGKLDVLSANRDAKKVAWVGISESGGTFSYKETVVAANMEAAFDVVALDANGDKKLDLVVSKLFKAGVHWFEAPAAAGGAWTQHTVDAAFEGTDLYAGDIDEDGQPDLAVAGFNMGMGKVPPSVAWFKVSQQGGATVWTKNYIDYKGNTAPGDVSLDDINGDGHLDLVTTAVLDGEVVWYENKPGK
jgi:hypothetical protein